MNPVRILLTASLLTAPLAFAAELSPEKVAEVRHAQKAALEKVSAAHGNRKPGEMDNDERSQVIEEQAAAAQSAFDQAGVSPKEFTTYSSRMSREEQAAAKKAEQELEAKDEAAAKKKAEDGKKDSAGGDIEVQQGISDEHPVLLEEREGAAPRVEVAVPAGQPVQPKEQGGRRHRGRGHR